MVSEAKVLKLVIVRRCEENRREVYVFHVVCGCVYF